MTTIMTPTGYTYDVATMPGSCVELLSVAPPERCAVGAVRHVLDLRHLDRGKLSACYCDAHGGGLRALAELRDDWEACAPPSVGDREAVAIAGAMALSSEHAIVVLRPEAAIWLAYLGIGSHMQQVANPAGGRLNRDRRPDMYRTKSGQMRWRGANSFASLGAAEDAARAAWRRGLDERIAEITRARGGTLAWGLSVEPQAEPRVLVVETGSAWEAYQRGEMSV